MGDDKKAAVEAPKAPADNESAEDLEFARRWGQLTGRIVDDEPDKKQKRVKPSR